jgi:hypothetical protein
MFDHSPADIIPIVCKLGVAPGDDSGGKTSDKLHNHFFRQRKNLEVYFIVKNRKKEKYYRFGLGV